MPSLLKFYLIYFHYLFIHLFVYVNLDNLYVYMITTENKEKK